MNIFKAIRRRYIDFLDYRDESEETFLNKKGEVVAIVTMCSPLSYLFHSIFHINQARKIPPFRVE